MSFACSFLHPEFQVFVALSFVFQLVVLFRLHLSSWALFQCSPCSALLCKRSGPPQYALQINVAVDVDADVDVHVDADIDVGVGVDVDLTLRLMLRLVIVIIGNDDDNDDDDATNAIWIHLDVTTRRHDDVPRADVKKRYDNVDVDATTIWRIDVTTIRQCDAVDVDVDVDTISVKLDARPQVPQNGKQKRNVGDL